MKEFKLSDSFIEQYKTKDVEWGPLGEFVYLRTYSRIVEGENRNENWWETVRRVVEGSFSIQKKHCDNLKLVWNSPKAQKSAQIMYDKIFTFRFVPSGRGLWMMGTEFVESKGSAALNNCAMISTDDIDVRGSFAFCWTMDALMLGVGVGFDTKGANKIKIKQPKSDGVFVIPDTREGWVESLSFVLDGFFHGKPLPVFDYSAIRPYGAIIKGFGGVASGPEPLEAMHKGITELLTKRIGDKLTSVDIVDIVNLISVCVVSGNVRRSACIAIGNHDDDDYVTMKDFNLHPNELNSHRWASNNSVFAEVGKTNYSKFAKSIALNGEPGIIWLDNLRKFSRTKDAPDYKDSLAVGVNPCFSGETLIGVADGRGAISIKQLAEEGLDVPVYSVNLDGMVEIKMGRNPRITGYEQQILKITLDDGSFIKTTPNHTFYLSNGAEKEAKNLFVGDSLIRLNKYITKTSSNSKDYIQVYTNTKNNKLDRVFEHRLIAEFHKREEWFSKYDENKKNGWLNGGLVIHHKDYNGMNNSPENLEIMTFKEHTKFHGEIDNSGERNGMFGKQQSEETKKLIGSKSAERYKDSSYAKKCSDSIKQSFVDNPSLRNNLRKTRQEEYSKWCEKFIASTDLETLFIEGALFVRKNCEGCGKEILLPVRQREHCFCSISCANTKKESVVNRKEGQKVYFTNKQKETLHNQIMVFKDLEDELGRIPQKKEWEGKCKTRKIPFRIRSEELGNEFSLKSYSDLKERATVYNHRVKNIEYLTEKETVYNITVDDNHNFFVMTNFDNLDKNSNGVLVSNCGEMTLENGELCCLVETFPSRHESLAEYKETIKYAYLYAKSVTLVPTHWPETNAVLLKNRRIGLSQSGIIDAFGRHGRREILNWCEAGYDYIQVLDQIYSDWLCIPRSKKTTTVKPSGSVATLPGVSSGIHYPHSEYYIRRVRIASSSPLLAIMKIAGYEIEYDHYGKNEESKKMTSVVSFPVHEKYFIKKKEDVTIWEQVKNVVDYQKLWADNNVSVTVTFKKDEVKDIPRVLECYEDMLKSISFLPLSEHGYDQAPYEEITKERYESMVSKITKPDYSLLFEAGSGTKFCDSSSCEV